VQGGEEGEGIHLTGWGCDVSFDEHEMENGIIPFEGRGQFLQAFHLEEQGRA